jgi:acyl dehydratase
MSVKGFVPESCIGRQIGTHRQRLSVRAITAYAAATGACDPRYYDDTDSPDPVAPPPFLVALEWPVLNGDSYRQVLGADQRMMQDCVHVAQDSRFHHLLRAGQLVEVSGRIAALRQTRAGVLLRVGLTTRDVERGLLLAESDFAAIFLGARTDAVADGETVRRDTRDLPQDAAEVALQVGRELPFTYTECSGIWNPIHTERRHARAAGFPDILLHGTCTWALACNAVVRDRLSGDPARLRRFSGEFHAPVFPPDTLTLRHAEVRPGEIALSVSTADGGLALRNAWAETA